MRNLIGVLVAAFVLIVPVEANAGCGFFGLFHCLHHYHHHHVHHKMHHIHHMHYYKKVVVIKNVVIEKKTEKVDPKMAPPPKLVPYTK